MNLAEDDSILRLIAMARDEDLGTGDISTSLIPDFDCASKFALIAKQNCVLAGRAIADQILRAYDASIQMRWIPSAEDGARITTPPSTLAVLEGRLSALLAVERVLLNFLQRLCGVATLTRKYVDAVEGTKARILDTRKTTPGWRTLEKYAVRCGGGENHRQGLFDAVLIKDNHLAGVGADRLAGAVFDMLNRLSSTNSQPAFVEVEAASLSQARELCKVVGIDVILLDNFSASEIREAVAMRNQLGLEGRIALEASGGVNLTTVRAIAETGVERISVGAITHSATAVDLCLDRLAC